MSKPTMALIFLLASSLFVFSVQAQERDDSRLTPAERNRTGTLRQLIPGYYVFSSTSFNSGVIASGSLTPPCAVPALVRARAGVAVAARIAAPS